MGSRIRSSAGERVFSGFNYVFLTALALVTVIPFWYMIVISLNQGIDSARGGVYFWPRLWTGDNFRAVFAEGQIVQSFLVSVARVGILTPTHLIIQGLAAWAISRKELPFRKFFLTVFIIAMFVNPGFIPMYMTLSNYGMIDHFSVYILPWLFSGFELMILVTAIRGISESIVESARLDGAGETTIFFRLVVPLTAATLATLGLFNGVWAWGDWFTGTFYITSHQKWSIATYLQMVLQRGVSRTMHSAADAANLAAGVQQQKSTLSEASMRAATLVVTVLPIMCVYPFLQKYFIHGVMVGSVKE